MTELSDSVSLKARWVLPMDAPPIDGGVVSIQDARIVSVDQRSSAGNVVDLGDVAILPGLVNPHTHLEFSCLKQPLGDPGLGFSDWVGHVVQWRRSIQVAGDQEMRTIHRDAIAAGLAESLSAGVTSLGEIVTVDLADQIQVQSPIMTVRFRELLGFKADRVEQQVSNAQRHLATPIEHEAGSGLEGNWERAERGLSPHAPYTVHPRLLGWACRLSQADGATVAMHLAESQEELELLDAGTGPLVRRLEELNAWDPDVIAHGTRPGDFLRVLERANRSLVIHGNFLSPEDWGFLAQRSQSMSVVFCPRTHHFFQHREYPLAAMLNAGVRVAIGTDSRASNPSLSLLDELRYVALKYPGIRPDRILRAGTLTAAQSLGIDPWVGSITVGKRADLAVVAIESSAAKDPWQALFDSQSPVKLTVCGGRFFPSAE